MTKVLLKFSKIIKILLNIKKDQICLKITINDQNTSKTLKMTKIRLKPKKCPKYPRNLKKVRNTPETKKMTKIP